MTPGLRTASRILAYASGFALATAASGATLVVTNTNDGGAGSLRQAILDANGTVGGDLIQFAIPGAGPHTIVTFSPLNVTGSTLIDGYSQPGSVWNADPVADNAVLQVELLGQGTDGLVITGGSSIVQGLALYGFQTAIAISGQPNVYVQGCFIGTDSAGNAAGNVVGVSITGTIGFDRVGDNYPAARNLISGNSSAGIVLNGADAKRIRGNLIGLDKAGSSAVPNGVGIQISGSENQVGGSTLEERNVVSGNFANGIELTGGNANSVQGNLIGTDATGIAKLGNGGHGIHVEGVSENFNILSNVISGNAGNGVDLSYLTVNIGSVQNVIATNIIGADASGASPIGNGGSGIRVDIGDALAISYNAIAFNRSGIWRLQVSINNSVAISENSIHDNHGLGIVLGGTEAIRPNSAGSPFNFPIITSVVSNGGTTTIDGYYSGNSTDFVTIELFHSPKCTETWPADFEEGTTFFASYSGSTDASGYMTFHVETMTDLTDRRVTATATVTFSPLITEGGFPTHQTSSFSQRLPFSITPRSGSGAGSVEITIYGTNFHGAAAVTIGGQLVGDVVLLSPQQISGFSAAIPAGAAHDVVVTNPGAAPSTLRRGFVADFLDVFPDHLFYDFIVKLVANGISGGTGAGNFSPDLPTLRQQMAVFLLRGKHGICYVPPPCVGIFADVLCATPFAPWIEALYFEGITAGCGQSATAGAGNYCPQNPVRRDQMAVFLLKAKHGRTYTPPNCTGVFADVPCSSPFAPWIEQLAAEHVTSGCAGGNYCPLNPTTRGQMAVLLTKAFNLQ